MLVPVPHDKRNLSLGKSLMVRMCHKWLLFGELLPNNNNALHSACNWQICHMTRSCIDYVGNQILIVKVSVLASVIVVF